MNRWRYSRFRRLAGQKFGDITPRQHQRISQLEDSSELAEAIVAAMRAAPTVTVDGRTICNCSECRRRRSEPGLIEG